MNSREKILHAVRTHAPSPVAAPSLDCPWIRYDDPRAQFAAVLQSVGGDCQFAATRQNVAEIAAAHPAWASAKKIVSLTPEIPGQLSLDDVVDPHTLEDVDFAVIPAQFAVAENGAVWTPDAGIRQRAILFIAQHLILVITPTVIVHNMHEAYARIQLPSPGYGVFISGPSKTADIEQSLVIGAHGPRSLTVILVDETP